MTRHPHVPLAFGLALGVTAQLWAQTPPRPDARVSFFLTSARRSPNDGEARNDFDFATAVTFKTPEVDGPGLDAGIDLRHTAYAGTARPQRVSLYNGFAGARLGGRGQVRLRAGHMWLPDLGTAGALAGGLGEYRSAPSGAKSRLVAGIFAGTEPLGYEGGYAPGVRKVGGYAALESGFLRRHVVGFANITQSGITERSLLTVTNYIPAGKSFFAYQALEYDVRGPANGAASRGLSYFLVNARQSVGAHLELQGTYNRGRSLDTRRLADEVIHGRALTPQAVDGLRYESAGGRLTVKVAPRVDLWAGYARDRNNREDASTGRLTVGGHATNIFGSGLDVTASDARIDRPAGPYHSRYISVGRQAGRSVYVSGDYSTSLAVVRFLRTDGVTIETRPWSRRVSGSVSATLSRQLSLTGTVDVTRDTDMRDLRAMTGLSYRFK